MIVSFWKLLAKAGLPGWTILVPIYNLIVLLKLAKKPTWWFVLLFVPIVNVIAFFILLPLALAKAFGKPTSFGVGIIFFPYIFIPLLAFGDSEFQSDELQAQVA